MNPRTVHNPLESISLDIPEPQDGAAIERLVCMSPPLEPNTCYAYLLLCSHFRDTCVVARAEYGLAGFVVGYRPPVKPDALFVWQVAVHEAARGMGLGTAMMAEILARDTARDVRFLEATVSPDNAASRALFESFARQHGAPCAVERCFPAALFGAKGHEPEDLFRIGPLNRG